MPAQKQTAANRQEIPAVPDRIYETMY